MGHLERTERQRLCGACLFQAPPRPGGERQSETKREREVSHDRFEYVFPAVVCVCARLCLTAACLLDLGPAHPGGEQVRISTYFFLVKSTLA